MKREKEPGLTKMPIYVIIIIYIYIYLKVLRPFFRKFSGMSDTRIFKELTKRETIYLAFLL